MKKVILILLTAISKVFYIPLGFSIFPTFCLMLGWAMPSRRVTFFAVLVSTFLADIMISFLKGYPILGYWSFFTYTGFLLMAFKGKKLFNHYVDSPLFFRILESLVGVTILSFIFWIWTNFGSWLFEPSYPKNITGIIQCYTMALPFLGKSLLSNAICVGLLLSIISFFKQNNFSFRHRKLRTTPVLFATALVTQPVNCDRKNSSATINRKGIVTNHAEPL
jgi:hypothetical protein